MVEKEKLESYSKRYEELKEEIVETSIIKGNTTPEDYYTENAIALTKEMFKNALEEYIK